MNDVGKFYITEKQELLEVLQWGESNVAVRNHTKQHTNGVNKIVWVMLAGSYKEVKKEDLELARLLYD